MVNDINDATCIATSIQQHNRPYRWKRWLKHSLYFKSAQHFFNAQQNQQLAQAIAQAESGHRGEIQIIIEGSLPSHLALRMDTRQRAEQLFAQYRVWDTEYNSGMLIYLNLCERRVEVVADRGIHQAVEGDYWHGLCQGMLPYFKQGQFSEGLGWAVAQLGQLLQDFDRDMPDTQGNELDNMPRLM